MSDILYEYQGEWAMGLRTREWYESRKHRVDAFRFHAGDGTRPMLQAPDPERGFVVGDIIAIDSTQERVVRHQDTDPRFKRVTSGTPLARLGPST